MTEINEVELLRRELRALEWAMKRHGVHRRGDGAVSYTYRCIDQDESEPAWYSSWYEAARENGFQEAEEGSFAADYPNLAAHGVRLDYEEFKRIEAGCPSIFDELADIPKVLVSTTELVQKRGVKR